MASADEFQAKNGLLVRIRPVGEQDSSCLVDLFNHLGATSRYQRFNRPLDDPPPEAVEVEALRLAQLPPSQGVAWMARADLPGEREATLAIARYNIIPPRAAEAALAVRDDMQGLGIGSYLLYFLVEEARRAGIEKLVALVQRDNRVLEALLRRSPYPLRRVEQGGYIYVEADLRGRAARP